ncbi:MAG: MarR family winged helix-turn-helix transcriptional regulator [Promethearchaeota archaeon]
MTKHEEKLANRFLLELINLSRHISNVSHEDSKIGGGIFILSIIESRSNCIMKNLVQDLNLGASTATRQVDLLVKEGLIQRDISVIDRRKVSLKLTEKGKQVYKRFKNHLIHVIRSSLKTYTKVEVNHAIEVLNTIVEHSEGNLPLKED